MRNAPFLFVLMAGLAGCAAQTSQPVQSPVARGTCHGLGDVQDRVAALYDVGAIRKAEPIYRKEFVVRAYQPRYVSGAKLYVQADHETNAAHLERVLSCHAVASRTVEHPNDPFRAEGVQKISVRTAGSMFQISVVGENREAGRAIWSRARSITEREAGVEVEQLSAAPAARGSL